MQHFSSLFKRHYTPGFLLLYFFILTCLLTAQTHPTNPRYTAPEGKPLAGLRICIDPGHGGQIWGTTRGYTGGTRSRISDQTESDANLRVGLYLWDLLTQAGAEVVMTRTFETRLSQDCFAKPDSEEYKANTREELDIRDRVAKANNCQFLVSIHHNAAGPQANFSRVFFFDSNTRDQGESKHSPETIAMSRKLADAITESLGIRLGLQTRPPLHGNFHVLRDTPLPAVLVECAFMTNLEQAERMEDPAYSRLAAIGIFEGIMKACPGDKPSPPGDKPSPDKNTREAQP